jgi:hypothetical protein
MKNKTVTALEWLVNEIQTKHDKSFIEFYSAEIQQALEMEKEQMIDAYDKNKMGRVNYGEQYYNETYGK